jgi:hypothetical protein
MNSKLIKIMGSLMILVVYVDTKLVEIMASLLEPALA